MAELKARIEAHRKQRTADGQAAETPDADEDMDTTDDGAAREPDGNARRVAELRNTAQQRASTAMAGKRSQQQQTASQQPETTAQSDVPPPPAAAPMPPPTQLVPIQPPQLQMMRPRPRPRVQPDAAAKSWQPQIMQPVMIMRAADDAAFTIWRELDGR